MHTEGHRNIQAEIIQAFVAIFLVGALLGGMAGAMGVLIWDGVLTASNPQFLEDFNHDNYLINTLPVVLVIFSAFMVGSLVVFLRVRKNLLASAK